MKAILIIDTPKECWECDLIYDNRNGYTMCSVTGQILYPMGTRDTRPDDCPLSVLPERKSGTDYLDEVYQHPSFDCGWNACLDKINPQN